MIKLFNCPERKVKREIEVHNLFQRHSSSDLKTSHIFLFMVPEPLNSTALRTKLLTHRPLEIFSNQSIAITQHIPSILAIF